MKYRPDTDILVKQLKEVQTTLSSLREEKEKLLQSTQKKVAKLDGRRRELREKRKEIMAQLGR